MLIIVPSFDSLQIGARRVVYNLAKTNKTNNRDMNNKTNQNNASEC